MAKRCESLERSAGGEGEEGSAPGVDEAQSWSSRREREACSVP